MSGHFVGPIPIKQFLDESLPSVKRKRTPKANFSQVPEGRGSENAIYGPFAAAITEAKCCPSFDVVDTSQSGDNVGGTKPCCGIFIRENSTTDGERHMALVDIPVEIKPTSDHDAFFQDASHSTNAEAEGKTCQRNRREAGQKAKVLDTGIRNRARQIKYIGDIMTLQYRTHVFSISVFGHAARIIRWDRSGAIVSDQFDYHNGRSNWLGQFLFRYEHATLEERGFDTTVQPATPTERALLLRGVHDYLERYPVYKKLKLEGSVDESYLMHKVRVQSDSEDVPSREYIVCRPFTKASPLFDWPTRGYLAWGLIEQELMFLKDTWRTEVKGTLSEAQAYERLKDHVFQFLPYVVISGDVSFPGGKRQCTKTQLYTARAYEWSRPGAWPRNHIHHRIVQQLALPLHLVRNSRQLTRAIRNTLQVILWASGKPGLLHRDISAGNIMLDEKMEGILNDWDHAIEVSEIRAAHRYRTGTWQFMSIAILQDPTKVHSIIDDVESCFWVFFYMACHYFPIKQGRPNLAKLFDEVSEQVGDDGKIYYIGGDAKATALWFDGITGTIVFKSPPLTQAINDFADLLGLYYSCQETAKRYPNDRTAQERLDTITTQLEKIEDILAIFDRAIASGDWPEDDDAVADQFPSESRMDTHRRHDDIRHAGFAASYKAGPSTIPLDLEGGGSDPDQTDGASSAMAHPPVSAGPSRPRAATHFSTRKRAAPRHKANSAPIERQRLAVAPLRKKRPMNEVDSAARGIPPKRGRVAPGELEPVSVEQEQGATGNRRVTRSAAKAAARAS
ncbi:hypothetical protein BDW22DRAFT_1358563 [Trametopsis cervina]|nr:hypothetical protein BDW22DRAFT_1358563 [Trametopsis cervina]